MNIVIFVNIVIFYIQNRSVCLSKKILLFFILYCFFALLGTASPLEKFYEELHSTKKLKENINHPWFFRLGKWSKRHQVYQFLKFMLCCRFSFEAYAKNIREKATKCSWNTTEILLDADGHELTYVRYLSRYNSSK